MDTYKTIDEMVGKMLETVQDFLWDKGKSPEFYSEMQTMLDTARKAAEKQEASRDGFLFMNEGVDKTAFTYKTFLKEVLDRYPEELRKFFDSKMDYDYFPLFKEMLGDSDSASKVFFEVSLNWKLEQPEDLQQTLNEIAESNGNYLLFRNEDDLKDEIYEALWSLADEKTRYYHYERVVHDTAKLYPEMFKEMAAEFAQKEPEKFETVAKAFPEVKAQSLKKESVER